VSAGTNPELFAALVLAGILAAAWIKNNPGALSALVIIGLRILFYLAVIVIGIYCLTRLM
jgi:hypothetical protein